MIRSVFVRIICIVIAVLMVVSVGIAAISSISANAASAGQYGFISATDVNLRSGPGTNYSVVTMMDYGTKIQFSDGKLYDSHWYKIKILPSLETGYVYSDYVEAYPETTSQIPSTAVPSGNARIYGDLNKDDEITIDDATLIQMHIASIATFSEDDVKCADVTGDNLVSIDDVTELQKFIAGLENSGKTGEPMTAVTTQPTTTAPKPTVPTTVKPVKPIRILNSSQTIYIGNQYVLYAADAAASVSWKSSNTSVATVDSNGIVTANGAGTVTMTASDGYNKATVSLTVKAGTYVDINKTSATVSAGKTIYLYSNTSGVKWKTSYYARATVSNGFAAAASKGYATITAYTSTGAATCLLNINDKEDIRYTYASPNSAPLNSNVTFYAITDTSRTAVQFVVSHGSTKYTVNATEKIQDGDTFVWSGTQKLSSSGEWSVRAYSKKNNSSGFTSNGADENCSSTVFVTTSINTITNVCTERRASSEIIQLIADYEGYLSSVTDDVITGDPTLGYGNVVYGGETFYNNITRREAYADLVAELNNGGYTSKLNSFLLGNSIKSNQRQFDALVCFLYNTGAYTINNDSEIRDVLLNTGSSAVVTTGGTGYVNDDYVNLRSGPGTNYPVVTTMPINTKFTFVSSNLYNSNWYNIKLLDGTTGYIYSDYASASGGTRTLDKVTKNAYMNVFFSYHHAGGSCYWGLLYRRVDEGEVFFYGDYIRDGQNNKKGFSYTCPKGGVWL